MKKMLTALFIASVATVTLASTVSLNGSFQGVRVNNQSGLTLDVEYGIKELTSESVTSEKGRFTAISLTGGNTTMQIGAPALPVYRNLIEVPAGATPEFEVISSDIREYSLKELNIEAPLAPYQPAYSKSSNPADRKFVYNPASYAVKSYAGEKLISYEKSGSLRGVEIGNLIVSPVSYNPAEGKIKVYTNLKVRVNFKNGDAIKTYQVKKAAYSPYFEEAYSHILNHQDIAASDKADITRNPVTYLILAGPGTEGAKLTELINWKKQKGFNVIVRSVTSSESMATIDSWVEQQYNTLSPKPTFLLIVGDCDGSYLVPTAKTGLQTDVSVSDLAYGVIGTVSSSNEIQSMYVGRFSVRSATDLAAQVDKTIWYEKGQFEAATPDLNYLKKPLGAAGQDASYGPKYGDPQIRYGWTYYFNNTYTNPTTGTTNGMDGGSYYLHATSGTADAAIVSAVSAGVNFYNYTAHGANNSFYDPAFSIANIDGLANTGKYPLVVGSCCVTGSFGDSECFGEAWLNAPNKGAIGYIGNSAYSYWDEDLVQAIGENANGTNYTPPLTANSEGMYDGNMNRRYATQGAIRFTGLLAVEAMSSTRKLYYWQMSHLFGDPSLMPYFGIPVTPTATYGTLSATATTFAVTTTPGAYVGLCDANNVLHGANVANASGVATLTITPFTSGGTAKLVVTGQQLKPYFANITVNGGSSTPTPSVTITAPANNSSYDVGTTVNVTATATESGKSITKVDFYVDNTLKSTDTSAPFEYAWNTTGSALGAHVVKAIVTSSYSLTAENSVTVNLTGTVPSVTSITEGFEGTTFPPSGWTITSGWYQSTTYYSGSKSAASKYKPANTCNLVTPAIKVTGTSSLEFYWKNNDPAKIVAHDTTFCEISTNGTTWNRLGFLSAASAQSSYTKAAYDITGYPGTAVKIRWRYKTDGTSSAYGITVDDVKVTTGQVVIPVTTVAITQPANNANVVKGNNVTITAAVSEAKAVAGKVAYKVEFFVDNTLLNTDTTAPFEYVWSTASATVAAHVIKTVATNLDNNQTATAQVTVNVIQGGGTTTLISEGFEGTTFPPTGWTLGSTGAWSKGSEAYAGTKCARALYKPSGTKILNAPSVNIPAGATTTLEFWWKNDDINAKVAKQDTTFCEISTNGTTWSRLGLLSPASVQSTYGKFTANVSAYTGSAVKIRWRYKTNGTTSAWGIGLDEVKLTSVTAKEEQANAAIPVISEMVTNYPNPFNPVTTISFTLANAADIKLAVYNTKGEVVKVLKEGFATAGTHAVAFDGSTLNSGMYFYTLSTPVKVLKGKMLLVK